MESLHHFTIDNTEGILAKIKADFGEEAMLVTQKQVRPKTPSQAPLYEVVVMVDDEDYKRHLASKNSVNLNANSRSESAAQGRGGGLGGTRGGLNSSANRLGSSGVSSGGLSGSNARATGTLRNSTLNSGTNSRRTMGDLAAQNAAQNSLQSTRNSRPRTRSLLDDEDVSISISKRAEEVRKKAEESYLAQKPKNALNDFRDKISEVSEEIAKIEGFEETAAYDKRMQSLEKQINTLSDRVSLMVDMIWQDKANIGEITIPPEFASIYKQAKASKMKDEHLQAIMKATIENMPVAMRTNAGSVSRYFHSLLRKMLPCRVESEIRKQKIMMLVGPTGVGKTTTLAKLAFRYAYGDKRYKTGIITLDTYRIGAVEQLFQYANMMKLPIIDSIEPKDLDDAIQRLNYCEVILVDTIGNSQYDHSKIAKTREFLSHSNADIDVNLVISANTKLEDLLDVYKNFSDYLKIDTLIITKFDETKAFGNVFSLIYETGVPMSFFSIGQEVPDDISAANSEFLVRCVLEGFKKNEVEG